jgi:hypothetical protein
MRRHEITFNTNLSEAPGTRADFTYHISPTVISITDTGQGSEDIEVPCCARSSSMKAQSLRSTLSAAMAKVSGTKCAGTARPRPVSL